MGNAKRIDKLNIENLLIEHLPEVVADEEVGIKLLDAQKAELLNSHFFDKYGALVGIINARKELLDHKLKEREKILRVSLKKKYEFMDELSEIEQNKIVLSEVLKIFETDQFKLARSNRVKEIYDKVYQQRVPKLKSQIYNRLQVFDAIEIEPYDLIEITKERLNYKFIYSEYEDKYLDVVRIFSSVENLFDFESPEFTLNDSVKLIWFSRILLEKFTCEYGEIRAFTLYNKFYDIFLLLKTVNEESVSDESISNAKVNKCNEYGNDIKRNRELLSKNATNSFLGCFKVLKTYDKSNSEYLVEFALLLESFISKNGGYIKPINSTLRKKRDDLLQLRIQDYQVCSLSELVQTRRNMIKEENNINGNNFYDFELAQQIDQLIQSRYEQMANRFRILQRQFKELSQTEILGILENIYDTKLINFNAEHNIFGQNVLARIPEESNEITFFEKFADITFSKQAKQAFAELSQNGTKAIARKIEEVLVTIQDCGNVGAFLEKCASSESLTYGAHKGKNGFVDCILFDIGSAQRLVINMAGDVLYIGDYHDQKR